MHETQVRELDSELSATVSRDRAADCARALPTVELTFRCYTSLVSDGSPLFARARAPDVSQISASGVLTYQVATLVSHRVSSVGRSMANRRTRTPHRSVDRLGIHAHDRPSRSLGKLALGHKT